MEETLSGMNTDELSAILQNIEKEIDKTAVSSVNIILALLLLIAGWFLCRYIGKRIQSKVLDLTKQEAPAVIARKIVRYGLYFVCILSAASLLGIPVSVTLGFSLVVLAALGVAVILSLKDDLALVAAGVMLLITHPFKLGDFIEVPSEDVSGYVTLIGLTQTHLAPKNRREVVIPNDVLAKNTIINYVSLGAERLEVTYQITYDSDYKKAIALIQDLIKDDPRVEHYKEPEIVVSALGENSVDILCKIFVKWKDNDDFLYMLNAGVKDAFDREGIVFAFPQVDVHMK